jgi:hypothetical protein
VKDNQDRLAMLKNKYVAEISKKESELKELRTKLHLIDELEFDAVKLTPTPNGELKFADGKKQLIDAALDTVNTVGTNGISASKVAKYLKNNGFPIKGKNFIISVGTSLRRLAERNEIISELKDGKRIFTPVNVTEFK